MAYSRQVKEQARRYFLLGLSYREIAAKPDMPARHETIYAWSKKYDWQADYEIIEEKLKQKRNENIASEIAEMDKEHLSLLKGLKARIAMFMRDADMGAREISYVAGAIDKAVSNERLIRREPTQRTESRMEHTGNMDHNIEGIVRISDMSIAQMEELISRLEE